LHPAAPAISSNHKRRSIEEPIVAISCYKGELRLTLHHPGDTSKYFKAFEYDRVLERLRALDERVHTQGFSALDPTDPLTAIGVETDATGRVTKYSYGVLNLSWQAETHPEWPSQIEREVEDIRRAISDVHGTRLRYVIWAGMGGSIEDKLMYQAVGLLRRGPRFYALDSTDPAKLKYILADIQRHSKRPLKQALRSTLVVGMAMGMTSYEPVLNLERLAALYTRHRIDSRPNFIYLTLPGSVLDQFAAPRGYRRVELQLDGANSTAGRHSGPLTRGSLYPLALGGVDLRKWIGAAALSPSDVNTALRLSAFLHAHGIAGRDKVTLLLPRGWAGAALWTKQDFEESLGKRDDLGLKIVIQEKIRLKNYREDRVFLCVGDQRQSVDLLRRAGYPVATLTLPGDSPLSRYMQFMHYVVIGVAYLRSMNFVTQPSVELYKSIAGELARKPDAWSTFRNGRTSWRGGLSLPPESPAPEALAQLLSSLTASREIEYAELTFFGDLRYNPQGRQMRRCLDRAGDRLFRSRLRLPVDIYEGPAMNHSYHEMIIGHGKCFSIVLLAETQDPGAGYHVAQFLATQMALQRRGRHVIAITVKDMSQRSLAALAAFFDEAAASLR
jgi:glucose-6-phosphate isomerase